MTFNYSGKEYHIDHIIPCYAFSNLNIEEQQKICFNWKNTQILKSSENLSKSNKIINIIPEYVKQYIKPELLVERM